MKSKMLQRRAAKQTKVAVTDETINQALLIADQLISDLSADDPRADAIAEIGDRLRAGSNDAAADVQQLAQFRRAIRGQRPTGNEPEEAAFVEGSGSDNFVMNNEHPDSVEQHIVEGSDQGSNGFVTDRDENGKPKTPGSKTAAYRWWNDDGDGTMLDVAGELQQTIQYVQNSPASFFVVHWQGYAGGDPDFELYDLAKQPTSVEELSQAADDPRVALEAEDGYWSWTSKEGLLKALTEESQRTNSDGSEFQSGENFKSPIDLPDWEETRDRLQEEEDNEVPRIATEDVNADKTAVAPPGWEGTVKEMKKHDEIDNPWALAWSMKNKGYHSHAALAALKTRGALSLLKEAGMKSKLAAPPAPAPPAPAADANIFNAWTSDCLAAAIKAVTSTAEYASDKAAQQGVGMMNDALKNRPAMPEQPGMATASAKKGSQGFQSYNEMTGVVEEGDKSIPSSHKEQELQGLDKSGKFPRPETVLPEKFAGEQGIKKLMSSLVLAGAE